MGNQNKKPQQQEVDDEEDQQETFTCEICIEPVILPNRKFKNSNKCVHPFCTRCIQEYIKHKLEENVSDIKCPAINCNHSLEILSCRHKITNQVFNKWSDALCESLVIEFSRVYCLNIQCSVLILDECGDDFDGRMMRCVCPNCKKHFCFQCKVPWHGAESSCKETMDENEAAFIRVLKRNRWKRCPKCRHCIEHVGGCNRVKCRCGIVFDYNSEIIEDPAETFITHLIGFGLLLSVLLLYMFLFMYTNLGNLYVQTSSYLA